MESSLSDLKKILDKNDIFLLSCLAVFIIYFSVSVVKIEISHFTAIILIILIFVIKTFTKKENSEEFNTVLEYKLNSLSDTPDDTPDFFYIDADLINIFFNIKQDFYEYNKDTYLKALKCANNVLSIRYDIERALDPPPEIPNLLYNYNTTANEDDTELKILGHVVGSDIYNLKQNPEDSGKNTLENAYENYQIADEFSRKCINYIHSYIINIPSNPVTHSKHEKVVKRLSVVLKRNIDIIKNIYIEKVIKGKKGITHQTKFFDDYDLPKAINKYANHNSGESNFGFF